MKYPLLMFFLLVLLATKCKDPAQQEVTGKEIYPCIDAKKIKEDAACIKIFKPVCGCDEITYSNDCIAANSGVISWTEGACDESKDSTSI